MKKGEFISTSRRMVKEYINYYVAKGGNYITLDEISIIGFNNIEGNLKCILYTLKTPGVTYKVTYNKETDELKSELIKMDGFRQIR